MAAKKVVLTDVAEGIWLDQFECLPAPDLRLSGSSDWSIVKKVLHGGRSAGVDVVELNNGALTLSIVPTRGMGIWRGAYKGIELGWKSPVQFPVNPCFVNPLSRGGLGWLDGFNEFLCRCGLAFNGPPVIDGDTPLTLHGNIANIPAHRVEVEVSTEAEGTLSVTGWVDETSMFGPRLRLESSLTTTAGSNRFRILDRVSNLGGRPAELELLYHTNIGPPFLEAGSRFLAPAVEVAPRDARAAEGIAEYASYAGPTAGYAEQAYYFVPKGDSEGRTLALLATAAGDLAISVQFQIEQLPCFALWKNTQEEVNGYVTGLEPATNYPNAKPFERRSGRVVHLEASAAYNAELWIEIHDGSDAVRAAEDRILAIQGSDGPSVHAVPHPRLSPTD